MVRRFKCSFLVCAAMVVAAPLGASNLDDAINATVSVHSDQAKTQKSIGKISDATSTLLERYRATQEQVDTLERYNEQLRTLLTSQNEELASIQEQISGVTTTGREMVPLMQDMLSALQRCAPSLACSNNKRG